MPSILYRKYITWCIVTSASMPSRLPPPRYMYMSISDMLFDQSVTSYIVVSSLAH